MIKYDEFFYEIFFEFFDFAICNERGNFRAKFRKPKIHVQVQERRFV